jgi:hypothetical protein
VNVSVPLIARRQQEIKLADLLVVRGVLFVWQLHAGWRSAICCHPSQMKLNRPATGSSPFDRIRPVALSAA